jgi:hypothetical protein
MKKRLLISFLLVAVLSFTVVSSVSANEPPVADPNGPYTVVCLGTTTEVTLDGSGSYDPDGDLLDYLWDSDCPCATFEDATIERPSLIVDASSMLPCTVTLTVTDNAGVVGVAVPATVEFIDTTPPLIACNAPGTINPTDAPISFTATATDDCDSDPSVVITGYESYKYTKKGKMIDKSESTVIELDGDTITILDTGGVDTIIRWTVSATDSSGNEVETTCEVHVVIPGRP